MPLTAQPNLGELLKSRFGHSAFRSGQQDVIESVLAGRDALAVMPTGGGKSLCYQLPALHKKGITLVISPLIALMKDQVDQLRKLGIPAASIHSGQDRADKLKIFSDLRTSENFVLYLSPERVQKPGFATWLKSQQIALFAIDESHCVSQWGHDFRPDYHKLKILRELRPDVPILALTATATPMVLKDISAQLGLRDPARHVYGFYRANLFCQVETCGGEAEKRDWLMQSVRATLESNEKGRILIYCGTRKQTEETTLQLKKEFSSVEYYHAGLSGESRSQIQTGFGSGQTRILVATNAFGMGIDHPDIRLVVHYQMPANIESYYQEIGRAGRDGKESSCLLLYSKKDKALHSFFIRQSQSETETNPQYIQSRWKALDTMTQFIEGGECRHSGILTYFRDTQRIKSCGHCDACVPDSPRKIIEVPQAEIEEDFKIAVRSFSKKKSRSKKNSSKDSVETLSREDELRAVVLREWRKSYADSIDLPAFVVFSNKTLYALAKGNPQSLAALAEIHGMGPKKIESFGKTLLDCMNSTRS